MSPIGFRSLFDAARGTGDGERVLVDVPDEWCIFGPNGGFIAACALRASEPLLPGMEPIGVTASFYRPMQPGSITLEPVADKVGRRSGFVTVDVSQHKHRVARVDVVATALSDSLEVTRTLTDLPPPPETVATISERRGEHTPGGFERVVVQRPLIFMASDHNREPASPDYGAWFAMVGQGRHPSPFADFGRALVVADVIPIAALDVQFPVLPATHLLPTLRLTVERAAGVAMSENLFAKARVSSAHGGVVSAGVQIFNDDGTEVATATQLGALVAH